MPEYLERSLVAPRLGSLNKLRIDFEHEVLMQLRSSGRGANWL